MNGTPRFPALMMGWWVKDRLLLTNSPTHVYVFNYKKSAVASHSAMSLTLVSSGWRLFSNYAKFIVMLRYFRTLYIIILRWKRIWSYHKTFKILISVWSIYSVVYIIAHLTSLHGLIKSIIRSWCSAFHIRKWISLTVNHNPKSTPQSGKQRCPLHPLL